MSNELDVVVIGAGAAGLTAAAALGRAGLGVTILEARARSGGRMFTLRDPRFNSPVELGAEFIHGRPPEIWNLLKQRKLQAPEVKGDNWCIKGGQLSTCHFFSDVDKILKKMNGRKRDESFLQFLEHCCPDSKDARLREAKEWATGYVTGFNAADPSLVGVHWLVKEMRAEEKIEGDRVFRAQHGYAGLLAILEQQLDDTGVSVQKSTVVKGIRWRGRRVEVSAVGEKGSKTFSTRRALITVPLGVLQAQSGDEGGIRFDPALPREKQKAIRSQMMGKVIRVTLRFRERFWEDLPQKGQKKSKTMAKMSFLFSHDDWFPTWWTRAPENLPFLTGWAPFRSAERLSGKSTAFVADQAIRTLHRLFGMSVAELRSLLEVAYCHDWQTDPFSRGAYTYGIVGGDGAEQALAKPIRDTLFFAGEATDLGGHTGTVHGAIASGKRAAREIVKAADDEKHSIRRVGTKSRSA